MADGERRKGIARRAGSSFIPHPSSFTLLLALAGAPNVAPAMAQELVDPTRPPAVLAVEPPVGEAVGSPVQQLQSVIISPKRKAAIISGVVVELGEKYGDAVLIKVAEDEVILKSGDLQQVLKLYPSVEKVEVVDGKKKPKAKPEPNTSSRPGPSPAIGGGKGVR